MAVQTSQRIKKKIERYLLTVPIERAHQVLRHHALASTFAPGEEDVVRTCLIEFLNRRRPNRVQRLFTEIFEPFLCGDEVLLQNADGIPGLLPRTHVAALWDQLRQEAFQEMVTGVQSLISRMAETQLLEDVLKTDMATSAREAMRDMACRHLETVFAAPDRLQGFIDRLARGVARRTGRAPLTERQIATARPVTRQFLSLVMCVLTGTEELDLALEEFWARCPNQPDGLAGAYQQGKLLARISYSASHHLGSTDGDLSTQIVPLLVLNLQSRYETVAHFVRRTEPRQGAETGLIQDALLGHLTACRMMLRWDFTATLNLDDRLRGATIQVPDTDRERFEHLRHRVDRIYRALSLAGMTEDSRKARAVQYIWNETLEFLGTKVITAVEGRLPPVLSGRGEGTLDFDDVAWLVSYLWRWQKMSVAFETYYPRFEQMRQHIMDDLERSVEQAMRTGLGETSEERLGHLVRLNRIATIFDADILKWIPISSQNMIDVVTARLRSRQPVSADEQPLIDGFAQLARLELRKSRYWQSDDLITVVALADEADQRTAASAPVAEPGEGRMP